MRLVVVLAADEDVGLVESARVHADRDALEQPVRIEVHQETILKGARLGLVRVDRQVPLGAVRIGQEGPLEPGREPCAASSTQHRVLHLAGDILRLHLQRLAQPLVPTRLDILVVLDDMPITDVPKRSRRDPLKQVVLGQTVFPLFLGHGALRVCDTRREPSSIPPHAAMRSF